MKRSAARVAEGLSPFVLIAAAVAGSLSLAFSRGGAADPPAEVPRADAGVEAGSRDGGASPSADLAVVRRFTEEMKSARIDAPLAHDLDAALAGYWRKLRPPFAKVPPDSARFVSSFSLRTSEKEEQLAVQTQSSGSGSGSWRPDVRLWNMNEGSFDQRESIVLPAPATARFPVVLPEGARVTFGAGLAARPRHTLTFRVAFVPTSGPAPRPCEVVVGADAARAFHDVTCDLSASAGQAGSVELSVKANEGSAEPSPRVRPRGDGGAGDEAPPRLDVALFAEPMLLGRVPSAPYNVLWIVVDALRPDVIASLHDDARDERMLRAEAPPLEALLPKVPGLMPSLDGLAKEGTVFRSATSAASWTRPGTLAMLSGARSSELGIETKNWVLDGDAVGRFYASDPPLLPLGLRRRGYVVSAFVNNYFLVGYTPIGLDMAFGQVVDHRYRTRDTAEVTKSALAFLETRKDTRFFAFVNYNSPHDPYDPPDDMLARVPPAPEGPKDPLVRRYMAEGAKDDAAIGELLAALGRLGLKERTLVVVTADHGETLSSAHVGKSNDGIPIRFHHSASNFEETTRVPIVLSLPGVVPAGKAVDARVRSTDIAPTVLDLLGLEPHPKMSGASMLGLMKGQAEPEARVVVTEGRGTRSILFGPWHFVVHDAEASKDGGPGFAAHESLFDLASDPGERHDLAGSRVDVVAEMRARLASALKNVAPAGSVAAPLKKEELPYLHARFAGAGKTRAIRGRVTVEKGEVTDLVPVGIAKDALRVVPGGFEIDCLTAPLDVVGFDLLTSPPSADVSWSFTADGGPLAAAYGGPFGVARAGLEAGVRGEAMRQALRAGRFPEVDPRRDDGLFVARDRAGGAVGREGAAGEGAAEMARMLREWGYANGPASEKKK
ncbi:MAG: sulfatase [Polyangiaceae bacterium]